MITNRFPASPGRPSLKRTISPLVVLGGLAAFGCLSPIVAPRSAPQVQAQGTINVYINDKPLNFGSARPARIGGRVFVPMRAIFEGLGAQVQWDGATQSINAQRGATVVQMQIGNRNAQVNGQRVSLDQAPLIYGGATMVPLRFVGEAMNTEVRWSEIQQSVFITDNSGTSNPLPNPGTTPGTPGTTPGTTPVTPINPGTTPGTTPVSPVTPGTPPGYTPPLNNEVVGTVAKVDATPPATITLRSKDASGAATVETYTLAPGVRPQRTIARFPQQAGAAPDWQDAFAVALPALLPGEEVRLKLNANRQVTSLTSQVLMAPAQVKSASRDQIVLNDGRDTTLSIGEQVKYVNKAGRPNMAVDARPGDSVALFVAPSTYTIFAVYARDEEIRQAGGTPNIATPTTPGTVPGTTPIIPGTTPGTIPGTIPGTTPGTVPPANNTLIQAVTHNATQPLKAGAAVIITVRGAMAGLRGSFTVSPRMTAQPLVERGDRAGIYTATYTVRPGDDVLNGRVTVAMTGPNNVVDTQQSQQPITIDTVAPRITGVFPSTGSQTNNTMPNISVYGDDIGGSGLSRGTISLSLPNGQAINVPAVVVLGGLSGETPRALPAGQISLRATVSDAAGNEAQAISVFTVMGNAPGAVNAVTHNARAALRATDVLVTELRADPNGRATFDLVGDNNRLIAVNLPMREIEAGRYQGTYTVQGNEGTNKLRVVGRFTGADNRVVTNEATTMVTLSANAAAQKAILTVTTPTDNAQVQSPLTISGRALGGAIVDVAIRAEGTKVTRVLLFESRRPYTQELGTQQIQAATNGVWSTRPIELPNPKDVEDLKFVITVTQTDSLNRRSDPITVTVTPK